MDQKTRITKAAGIMSAATFISRILGYVKDMILAAYFGASGLSDAFFAAFRIPNLLRELFAEGSMSSAFIPVLTIQGGITFKCCLISAHRFVNKFRCRKTFGH